MTDKTNPRARLDPALAEMRRTNDLVAPPDFINASALLACAEALSLLVDVHLPDPGPEPEPNPDTEPDPRESLPDDTLVGHRWVMGRNGQELFRQRGNGYFTWWFRGARKWGAPGGWSHSGLGDTRPATVGDLRRVELPVTEWPDITAPEPELNGTVVLADGNAYQLLGNGWYVTGGEKAYTWADLCLRSTPTVIHTPKEVS